MKDEFSKDAFRLYTQYIGSIKQFCLGNGITRSDSGFTDNPHIPAWLAIGRRDNDTMGYVRVHLKFHEDDDNGLLLGVHVLSYGNKETSDNYDERILNEAHMTATIAKRKAEPYSLPAPFNTDHLDRLFRYLTYVKTLTDMSVDELTPIVIDALCNDDDEWVNNDRLTTRMIEQDPFNYTNFIGIDTMKRFYIATEFDIYVRHYARILLK